VVEEAFQQLTAKTPMGNKSSVLVEDDPEYGGRGHGPCHPVTQSKQ
jgi:hypothetical protein